MVIYPCLGGGSCFFTGFFPHGGGSWFFNHGLVGGSRVFTHEGRGWVMLFGIAQLTKLWPTPSHKIWPVPYFPDFLLIQGRLQLLSICCLIIFIKTEPPPSPGYPWVTFIFHPILNRGRAGIITDFIKTPSIFATMILVDMAFVRVLKMQNMNVATMYKLKN